MKRRKFLTTVTQAFAIPILVQQPLTEKPGKTSSDSSNRDGRKQEKQKKAPSSAPDKKTPARSDDNNPFGKAGEEQEQFFKDLPGQLLDAKKLVTLGLGVSAVGGRIIYTRRRQRRLLIEGQAHFATWQEIKHLLRSYHKPPVPGEILIGHYVGIPLLYERFLVLNRWTALRHLLVWGSSGSGKSRSIFLINCFYNRQTSFVATDPKSELWSHTAARQTNAIRFAPSDPDNSISFNFVPWCKDTAIADRLTDAIIYAQGKRHGDVYWENAERQLLKVLLIHAAHSATPVLTYVYELICADHQVLSKILTASPVATVRREARPYIERSAPLYRRNRKLPHRSQERRQTETEVDG
jgi:hypothetical protein